MAVLKLPDVVLVDGKFSDILLLMFFGCSMNTLRNYKAKEEQMKQRRAQTQPGYLESQVTCTEEQTWGSK